MLPGKQKLYAEIDYARQVSNDRLFETLLDDNLNMLKNGEKFIECIWTGLIDNTYEKIIIWSVKPFVTKMNRVTQIFVDGTFKITPVGFYQFVTIMYYCEITNMYLPCMFFLLTGKTESIYNMAFSLVRTTFSNWKSLKYITCDFEKALMNSLFNSFSGTELVGCFFHFKQANYRQLQKLKIPFDEINRFLPQLNNLLLVPRNEVANVFEFYETNGNFNSPQWKSYWKYLYDTWCVQYCHETWTMEGREGIFHTNNGLERFNKTLNDKIGYHKTFLAFAKLLKDQVDIQIDLYTNTLLSNNVNMPSVESNALKLTEEYKQFKTNQKLKRDNVDVSDDEHDCWWCREKKKDDVLACDKCDHWFHYSCANIEKAPEDNWFCKWCNEDVQQERPKYKKMKKRK